MNRLVNSTFFLGLPSPAKRARIVEDLTPGSSSRTSTTPKSKSKTSPRLQSMDSPFNRFLKLDIRSKAQLKCDLEITKFLVAANLPFNLVSTQAFKDLVAFFDKKYHVKNHTTFSKAKLPLLYKQVKEAVTLKMKKELPGTNGIAFTSDFWSSR